MLVLTLLLLLKIAAKLLIEPELLTIFEVEKRTKTEIVQSISNSCAQRIGNELDQQDLCEKITNNFNITPQLAKKKYDMPEILDFSSIASEVISPLTIDNIDFTKLDQRLINRLIEFGLLEPNQIKPYQIMKDYKENDEFKAIFVEIKNEFDNLRPKLQQKCVPVPMNLPLPSPISKENELQKLVRRLHCDTSALNRAKAGALLVELQKMGYDFIRNETSVGLPHDMTFTYEISNDQLGIKIFHEAKKRKDASDGCLMQLKRIFHL